MEMMGRRAQEWPAGPIHACSLSGTHRRLHTHPTPPPARPERKGSLLFPHNGSRRAAKALKTKGGYFRKCRVCRESRGKVHKQAFRMPSLMLVTKNQENYFSVYSCSNWDLTNEYIMSKEQCIHTLTREKAAAQQRARASHHFKARQFQLLFIRERSKVWGQGVRRRDGSGRDAQNPGLKVCSTRAENIFPAKSSLCFGSSRKV